MMSKKPKMPKAGNPTKDAVAMPRFGARAMRPGGMAKGGKIHADAAMDKKLIRKEIARAEKMEDKAEGKGMKAGGGVKKMFRGGAPGGQTFAAAPPRPGMMPQGNPSQPAGSTRPMNAPRPVGKPAPAGMGSGPRSQLAGMALLESLVGPGPRTTHGLTGPKRMMARGGGVERKGKTKGKFI